MTNTQDIRWLQRFQNFKKAHRQLQQAIQLMQQRNLSELEKQGTIQAFEFTYELAWNVLRDFLIWQGAESISGSRDAIREAFKRELIIDGHAWLEMLKDRNRTVHTYNETTANEILKNIQAHYGALFNHFSTMFQNKSKQLEEE